MSSTSPAPVSRRRPARQLDSSLAPSLIDSFSSMSLRKGDTFHAPNNAVGSDFWDPLEAKACSPPIRSPTCPKSLEDLLIGSGERRTTELLDRLDQSVKIRSKLAISSILTQPDVLPVPTFAVHDTSIDEVDLSSKLPTNQHSHESDSGLGSSVSGSEESSGVAAESNVTAPTSMEDRSIPALAVAAEQRGLSKYASEQIYKYIVKPILREAALQDFHPLIKDVPSRIGSKEIKNLRDLEKTLIFLAPDFSRSPSKYLQFCERTVRVLHTTVTTLHESDQRAPADRPYTQGYFFDLVEQIRRYASILAATREKQSRGEKLDEMDYSAEEKVSLVGGMSHNGRPAELVRHKDGKAISVATGQMLDPEELASASTKRPMADDFDADLDDDALRSMARRKKNAKPEIHTCSVCDKEFKRPCDLTKHHKTHERPWKCPFESCKYHEHGWPTEKECDRHVNDKHSNDPPLFHCLYKPCPYTSKRESNCKQHMEKAHGWEYVRSKNNGKGGPTVVARLPKGSVPQSPASSLLTPLTPIAPSPSLQSWSGSDRRDSSVLPPTAGPSTWSTPSYTNMPMDFNGHFNWDFNNMAAFPLTPAHSDDRCLSSAGFSSHSGGLQLDGSAFDDSIAPGDVDFDSNFNFSPNDFEMPPQTGTPASSAAASGMLLHNTSPGAQLDQTFNPNFYDDSMVLDQEYPSNHAHPQVDFPLFDVGASASSASAGVDLSSHGGADMFQELAGLPTSTTSWEGYDTSGYDSCSAQLMAATDHNALDELFPDLKPQ